MKHARSATGAFLAVLMVVVLQAVPSLATTTLAISSFAPKTGQVGASVVVTGSGFTGATDTAFNGTSATFTVNSDTKITTSVPTGATTGPITVTTPAGTATSVSIFKVVPTITGFSPPSGPVGTAVTITGTAFTGATGVRFNATPAEFTVDSWTQITATVPASALSGPIQVRTPGGIAGSSASFIVTGATIVPTPTSGPPGAKVIVSGSGFGSRELVDIDLDVTDLALVVATTGGSFSGIAIKVPASTLPGDHWVTAAGRSSGLAAQAPFTVSTDWPQFRMTLPHTAFNRTENVLSTSTAPGLEGAWSYTTGSGVFSSPAVANGVVYVGSDDSKVYAFEVPGSLGTPNRPNPASLRPDYSLQPIPPGQ